MSFCYSNKNLELAILEDQRLMLNAFHDFLFNFKKMIITYKFRECENSSQNKIQFY